MLSLDYYKLSEEKLWECEAVYSLAGQGRGRSGQWPCPAVITSYHVNTSIQNYVDLDFKTMFFLKRI